MKIIVLGLTLLIGASSAGGANLLVNGDFSQPEPTGWTRWWADWGNYADWTISGGTGYHGLAGIQGDFGTIGSYGWFQVVPVPAGEEVHVTGLWRGDVDPLGWAEIMLFSVPVGTPIGDVSMAPGTVWYRVNEGAAADIAFKKDGFGMNPPEVWGWEAADLSTHPAGNGGSVTSLGWVVVATKIGTNYDNASHDLLYVEFDEIYLVPEPATLLLLALPLAFVRRRRRP